MANFKPPTPVPRGRQKCMVPESFTVSVFFSFNIGEYKFITISKFGAHCSKEPSDHEICFNIEALVYRCPSQ